MGPMTAIPLPRLLKNDGEALCIEWADGTAHRLTWADLRRACPCASCRVERAKPPRPKPLLSVLTQAEAQPLAPISVKPIGNYAYGIAFNDGHSSGIYSLELLWRLGESIRQAAD